ncbi:MAG: hypothetical protein ACK5OB_19700 [Pirellula sp.]
MARCSACGNIILFGGVKDFGHTFCNEKCHEAGYLIDISQRLPWDAVAHSISETHQGRCPRCDGHGPVDIHTSHWIWSALILTSWNSKQELCCRSCGVKSILGATLFSGVLGWWGFPWGMAVTPIQIFRNLKALVVPPDPSKPSDKLEQVVRMHVASRWIATQQLENITGSEPPVMQ